MNRHTSTLHIWAFGSARVVRDGQTLSAADWTYTQSKDLLFYLLMYGPQTGEKLAALFWPSQEPARRRHHLELTAHHLRRALGGADGITFDHGVYAFNRQRSYWFDAEDFEQRVAEAERLRHVAPAQAIRALEGALALYQDTFPAVDTWGRERHAELHRTYSTALLMLGQIYNGRWEHARLVNSRWASRPSVPAEGVYRALTPAYSRREEPDHMLLRNHMITKYA
jgi:DNA-binding SARP family transcriptional activator